MTTTEVKAPGDATVTQRWLARLALVAAAAAVLVPPLVAGLRQSLALVLVGLAGLALTAAAAWWALTNKGLVRALAVVLAVAAPLTVLLLYTRARLTWVVLVALGLLALAVAAGRAALRRDAIPEKPPEYDVPPPRRPFLIMNPRSGGGKVTRFGLKDKAEALGATVAVLDGPGPVDVGELARTAVADGADLLGVAGGDGTQALVAAIAAEHDVPLLVISAGTRNHFALDLGLDREDPSRCLDALSDGVELRVDLGVIGDRPFVNNASFGAYAAVVQSPAYRDDKRRTTTEMLPDLLAGQQGPHLVAGAENLAIEGPQAVLVSNNVYGMGDIAGLGRRAWLDRATLGVFAVKVNSAPQAAGLLAGTNPRGLIRLAAPEVVVDADGTTRRCLPVLPLDIVHPFQPVGLADLWWNRGNGSLGSSGSGAFDRLQPAGSDRVGERLVVALVLVGVALGKGADRPVERVALAQVFGDRDRIPRARVGPGQGATADAGVEAEGDRRHRLDLGRGLHVPQLAPVEVAGRVGALGPAQVDVAGGLHHPLPLDDALAVLAVAALSQVVLQDRGGRLLDLEEQWVVLVAALEQGDERPGADAAHPDHLAGQVDEPEPLQQLTAIVLEGGPVGPELLPDRLLDLVGGQAVGGVQVPHRDHDRGLANDPVLPIDHLAELRQRLQAVTRVGLLAGLLGRLLGPLGRLPLLLGLGRLGGGTTYPLHELVLVQVGVPDVHRAHGGEAGHGLPIGRHRGQRGRRRVGLGEAVVAAGDGEAGRQPLDVVLERPGRVSSKSLRSNSSRRSGEANRPKLDRCASPHSWACR